MASFSTASDIKDRPVLVVEDDAHVRRLIKTLLEYEKIPVIEAEDGQAGLEAALSCNPVCIVTDSMMPRMDGITMLRELRARGVKAPALVVSAAFNIPEGEERQKLGISRVVKKPFTFDNLIRIIKDEMSGES